MRTHRDVGKRRSRGWFVAAALVLWLPTAVRGDDTPSSEALPPTVSCINDYAEALGKGALTDATAKKLRDESIAIEESETKMKRDFAPRLDSAVGAVKAARYQQIENKIRAVIKYELAAGIPLAN